MAFVRVYIPGEGFRQVDTKSSMSVDKARRDGGNVTLDTKSENVQVQKNQQRMRINAMQSKSGRLTKEQERQVSKEQIKAERSAANKSAGATGAQKILHKQAGGTDKTWQAELEREDRQVQRDIDPNRYKDREGLDVDLYKAWDGGTGKGKDYAYGMGSGEFDAQKANAVLMDKRSKAQTTLMKKQTGLLGKKSEKPEDSFLAKVKKDLGSSTVDLALTGSNKGDKAASVRGANSQQIKKGNVFHGTNIPTAGYSKEQIAHFNSRLKADLAAGDYEGANDAIFSIAYQKKGLGVTAGRSQGSGQGNPSVGAVQSGIWRLSDESAPLWAEYNINSSNDEYRLRDPNTGKLTGKVIRFSDTGGVVIGTPTTISTGRGGTEATGSLLKDKDGNVFSDEQILAGLTKSGAVRTVASTGTASVSGSTVTTADGTVVDTGMDEDTLNKLLDQGVFGPTGDVDEGVVDAPTVDEEVEGVPELEDPAEMGALKDEEIVEKRMTSLMTGELADRAKWEAQLLHQQKGLWYSGGAVAAGVAGLAAFAHKIASEDASRYYGARLEDVRAVNDFAKSEYTTESTIYSQALTRSHDSRQNSFQREWDAREKSASRKWQTYSTSVDNGFKERMERLGFKIDMKQHQSTCDMTAITAYATAEQQLWESYAKGDVSKENYEHAVSQLGDSMDTLRLSCKAFS